MGVGTQASNRIFIVVRKSKRNQTHSQARVDRKKQKKKKKRLDTELAPETQSADSKACCVKFWLFPGEGMACRLFLFISPFPSLDFSQGRSTSPSDRRGSLEIEELKHN